MEKEHLQGKLVVILHADVAGSTRLVQKNEQLAHERIQDAFHRFSDSIEKYMGRVLELRGDALLAEFERASDAITAALAFQVDHTYYLSRLKDEMKPSIRVGIAMGEVIVADGTVTGAGVVLAQRVEQLADPGGVYITAALHEALPKRMPFDLENLGEQVLKGFDDPVRIYRVELSPGESIPPPPQNGKKQASQRRWNPMVAAALFVLVIIGGFDYWSKTSVPQEEPASVDNMVLPLPEVPSIAVLPFSNLSRDPEQEYFSDGLTANVITTLSQLPDVVVIARDSMLNYRDRPAKIRYVAEELGIRYVLDGSFQRTAERVRVHAQLIDALTGKHLWADRFDKPWTDIFTLQDTITENIVAALEIKLTEEQKARLAAQFTNSIQAYEYFLRGQSLYFRYTREDNLEARQLYLQAIELDPNFARAYSAVSFTYDQDYHRDLDDKNIVLGLRYARKGIALDADLPHTHVALGRIGLHSKNPDQAAKALHRAIELDANFADAYAQLAAVYTSQGLAEKAFPLLHKAVRLNPNHGAGYDFILGKALYYTRRYEDAVIALERAVEANPARIRSRLLLAASYAQLGLDEDAEWQVDEVTANHESDAIQAFLTGWHVIDQTYREHLEDGFRKAGLYDGQAISADKPSIVVLPFLNMSADPSQEYFVDGMTEDLITDLAKIESLFVIARNTAFTYKGMSVAIPEVAKELGVKYVLEGSVRRDVNQVRINAQLIDGASGAHVWAERYDGTLADVFTLQDKVTGEIMAQLKITLTPDEQERQDRNDTNNPDAHDAYLRGRQLFRLHTPEDFVEAIKHFERAVEIDPDYGQAWAALASVYWISYQKSYAWTLIINPNRDVFSSWLQTRLKAVEYLEQAMRHPTPLAHQVESQLSWDYRQFDKALSEAERAVTLDPNDPEGHLAMAWALIFAGRAEEAIASAEKGMQLDPYYPAPHLSVLGIAQLMLKQYTEAEAALERALGLNPEDKNLLLPLMVVYVHLDKQEQASDALKQFVDFFIYYSPRIEVYIEWWPFKRETDIRFFGRGLVKAGVCCEEQLEAYIGRVRQGGTLE